MKKHARRRDAPQGPILFADDPDDWETMHQVGRNGLRCPEDGCTAVLSPRKSPKGTHFLAYVPQQHCGHDHWTLEGGGGPVSDQHRWLQRRLVAMARKMGFDPVPEHPPTRADVYVPETGLAIEVQLRRTEFQARSDARRRAGATGVLWMLSAEALPNRHQRHLFEQQAVRWRAVHRRTKAEVRPWDDPSTDRDAWVQVYGTVAALSPGAAGPTLATRPMDGYAFLQEVLQGARVWVRPGTSGMPVNRVGRVSGGWVRPEDLRAAQAALQVDPGNSADEQAATEFAVPDVAAMAAGAGFPRLDSRAPEESPLAVPEASASPSTMSGVSNGEPDHPAAADQSVFVPEYRIVPVDRLPHPQPFRTDCMRPPVAPPRRRWWQWRSRRLPEARWSGRAECCWYHRGDWSLACGFAVAEVRRALASGATGWAVRDMVLAAVRESVTDPWQEEAIESLIDSGTAIVIDDPMPHYVNGQHRVVAMRDQGVLETVVV